MISGNTRLEHEHACVEVERWRMAHGGRPPDLFGALLAVANLILWSVAPCLFTEAVHDGVEMPVRQIEQLVDVVVNLDVSVQVHHFAVLHELSK